MISLFFKGIVMGIANVIPGVSGGTIAFITGIYERLIHALKSFDLKTLRLLLKKDIMGAWNRIDGAFLSVLFAGILLSIVGLAKLMLYLFEHHWILILAFFFGLIAASALTMTRLIKKWGISRFFFLLLGATIAIGISFLTPAGENPAPLYLFLCGMLAICSMIVPGVSGSYVLLLMGNYLLVLTAISERNFSILIPIGIGAIIGLALFAHLLDWIFKRYHDIAISLLAGFVFGSLLLIWPWKTEHPLFAKENVVYLKEKINGKRTLLEIPLSPEKGLERSAGKLTGLYTAEKKYIPLNPKHKTILRQYTWFIPSPKEKSHQLPFSLGLGILGIAIGLLMERWQAKE